METAEFEDLIRETCRSRSSKDGFYVCDVGEILNKHETWVNHLPRVRPFYAIKCNSCPIVLEVLASLGIGFECASMNEIEMVLERGVSPENIIYANPVKQESYITQAASRGVNLMTFDNEHELTKIKDLNPDAKLVLRIKVNNNKAKYRLGLKFGAEMDEVPHLLKTAKDLGLNVVGCAFHVGSALYCADAYRDAIKNARHVMDLGNQLGFNMKLLDMGGGFPGGHPTQDSVTFEQVAKVINEELDKYFPEFDQNSNKANVVIIAEPGRYYVTTAFTVVCNITGKRTLLLEDKKTLCNNYYVNDGVYGSFSCSLFEDFPEVPRVVQLDNLTKNRESRLSTIWGHTCDSTDVILQNIVMPEFYAGEWLTFSNMGAYSVCMASEFNGFRISKHMKYHIPSTTASKLKLTKCWTSICELVEE